MATKAKLDGRRSGVPGSANPYSVFCKHHETSSPIVQNCILQCGENVLQQGLSAGIAQADQKHAMMRTWGKSGDVGEIHVLRNQEATGSLCFFPNSLIIAPTDAFVHHSIAAAVSPSALNTMPRLCIPA